nr:metallophosphoesterase [Saprospiraceae bacterium]
IQELRLEGLQTATPYYYEVEAIDENGEQMKSGRLTFSTAVAQEDAFSFCILGDTESRPHINQQLGKMVWGERPNFIMHLGDVTDGGKEPHKFQWTQEYFTGITPVASRIPVFPVPGNGESDLYWYNRYHALPEPESYYSFTFGNAEFFMLNSNERQELQLGGKQYEWLKNALEASTSQWKFVAHHHCPISSDENDFGDTWAGKESERGDPRFDDLKRLYEQFEVDVVFYGHVHAYERSWPLKDGQIDQEKGVIYLKSGGAGGNLEDFTPTRSFFTRKVQHGHHYCLVDIYQGKFSFKMFDLDGRLKDFFELEK